MAKSEILPGISAQLDQILMAAKPADISVRKWCEDAQVSTSFFTDLRKGAEPGIDKVERLARRAGLSLSQLLDGVEAPPPELLPNADQLAAMVADAQGELQPGTTLADYPRAVGPALLARLQRYVADRRGAGGSGPGSAPDKGAQSRSATSSSARG